MEKFQSLRGILVCHGRRVKFCLHHILPAVCIREPEDVVNLGPWLIDLCLVSDAIWWGGVSCRE